MGRNAPPDYVQFNMFNTFGWDSSDSNICSVDQSTLRFGSPLLHCIQYFPLPAPMFVSYPESSHKFRRYFLDSKKLCGSQRGYVSKERRRVYRFERTVMSGSEVMIGQTGCNSKTNTC